MDNKSKKRIEKRLIEAGNLVELQRLGGPELAYFIEASLELLSHSPQLSEWKEKKQEFRALALLMAEMQKQAVSEDMLFYLNIENSPTGLRPVLPVFYQALSAGALCIVSKQGIGPVSRVAEWNGQFCRTSLVLLLKKLILQTGDSIVFQQFVELLLVLVADESVQNVALRAALELSVSTFEFSHLFRALWEPFFQQIKSELISAENVLTQYLAINEGNIVNHLQCLSEVLQEIRGVELADYLHMIRGLKYDLDDVSDCYVEPDAEEKALGPGNFYSKINEFLANKEKRVCVLFGDKGSGKTLCCKVLALRYLEDKHKFFPVYIHLSACEYRKPSYISKELVKRNIDHKKLKYILFILDGCEMVSSNLIEKFSLFKNFPYCKVLATCTTHESPSQKYFSPVRSGKIQSNQLYKLFLLPFSVDKIKEYSMKILGVSCTWDSYEQLWGTASSDEDILLLLSNPCFMEISLKEPALLRQCLLDADHLDKLAFFYNVFAEFQKRQVNKFYHSDIQMDCSEVEMKRRATKLCMALAFVELKEGEISHFDRNDDVLKCCPFTMNQNFKLNFINSGIRNVLVKEYLRKHLRKINSDSDLLKQMNTSKINQFYFSNKTALLSFLGEGLEEHDKMTLFRIVQASASTDLITIAASNAISILNHSHYSFKDQYLPNIKITHANLTGANFIGTFLKGSDFSYTNLTHANFLNADLSYCNFYKAKFGRKPPLYGHHSGVTSLAVSQNSQFLVSASKDKTIKVWDLKNKHRVEHEIHCKKVQTVGISNDNSFILAGGKDSTIRIFNIKTHQEEFTLRGHSKPVTTLSISPTSPVFASGSEDNSVIVWDFTEKTLLQQLECHTAPVRSVFLSPDAKYLISGSSDKTVLLWDVTTSSVLHSLVGHFNCITSVKLTSDNSFILSSSLDATIRLWDFSTGSLLITLKSNSKPIACMALSPQNSTLVAGTDHGAIIVWRVPAGQLLSQLQVHRNTITQLLFTPDNKHLISSSLDCSIQVINTPTIENSVFTQGHSDFITAVAISSDNYLLISGSLDKRLKVWDLRNGQLKYDLAGNSGPISSVGAVPGTRYVISGSADGVLKMWDTRTGTETFSKIEKIDSLEFGEGSRLIGRIGPRAITV